MNISKKFKERYPLLEDKLISRLPDGIKIYLEQDTVIMRFNSIKEIGDLIKEYLPSHDTLKKSSITGTAHFTQSESIEEALSFLDGTKKPKGSEDIKNNIVNKLLSKGIIGEYFVEELKYSEEGTEIDISKYLAGDKDCFLEFKNYNKVFYSLNINLAVLSRVDPDVYNKNIEKIYSTIYNMEKEDNVKIEINGIVYSEYVSTNDDAFFIFFPIKKYDEILNLDRLLSVTHVSFFRRLMFFLREAVFDEVLVSGYGQSVNSSDFMLSMNSQIEFTNEIILEKFLNQYEITKLKSGSNNYWRL